MNWIYLKNSSSSKQPENKTFLKHCIPCGSINSFSSGSPTDACIPVVVGWGSEFSLKTTISLMFLKYLIKVLSSQPVLNTMLVSWDNLHLFSGQGLDKLWDKVIHVATQSCLFPAYRSLLTKLLWHGRVDLDCIFLFFTPVQLLTWVKSSLFYSFRASPIKRLWFKLEIALWTLAFLQLKSNAVFVANAPLLYKSASKPGKTRKAFQTVLF